MRKFLANRQTLLVGASVLMLGLTAALLWGALAPPDTTPRQAYYFDLDTGEVVTHRIGSFTPIRLGTPEGADAYDPSGHAVRAFVLSCGSCADPYTHVVGWLEMHNPDYLSDDAGRGHGDASPAFKMMMLEERDDGILVRRVSDTEWVGRRTNEGRQLIADARSQCGDRTAVRCEP